MSATIALPYCLPCVGFEPPRPSVTLAPAVILQTHLTVLAAEPVCAHSVRLQGAGGGVAAAICTFLGREWDLRGRVTQSN